MDLSMNPHTWLVKLNQTILAAQCKIDGQMVNMESGCLAAGSLIKKTIRNASSIWWIGNGGSAAICSHLSQDLLNKLGARSFYLGDPALMTCMANDYGYKNVYRTPLEKLSKEGDVLIAISSSGNSPNILSCVEMANAKKMNTISLSGFSDSNKLWNAETQIAFFIDANLYGIVEVSHEAILHSIIESLFLQSNS